MCEIEIFHMGKNNGNTALVCEKVLSRHWLHIHDKNNFLSLHMLTMMTSHMIINEDLPKLKTQKQDQIQSLLNELALHVFVTVYYLFFNLENKAF